MAASVIESVYYDGYVAHAPVEPHTAASSIEGDKITVWASAQTPFLVINAIMEKLDITAGRIRIIVPFE